MSRLLTLLLLYRSGYSVGKYVSIEKAIENTKDSYYDVLQECSFGWHEGKNTYMPFLGYYLGIILSTYRELTNRVEHLCLMDSSGFFLYHNINYNIAI